MFKKIGILALVFLFLILVQNRSEAFWFKKKPVYEAKTVNGAAFAPVNNVDDNLIWVGTFQLVWNDLMDEIVKGEVKFSGFKSDLADTLNKQGFNVNYLSDESYYKTYGNMTLKLKNEIEKNIKKKFNETSDILDGLNWGSDGLLIYAMLKKDFEFIKAFKELPYGNFEGKQVKFFGVDKNTTDKELRKNVEVLFYNSEDEYAVRLETKNNEDVILYRTDDNKTFEEFLKDMTDKTAAFNGDKAFSEDDTIKIPYTKFDKMFEYNELANKPIEGTDYVIDGAVQTVKFNMDNKGGSLKSEAALMMKMSLRPDFSGRAFNFDKPFVLFLKEKDKDIPYFMVNFKNAELFVK